jgi:hypothetical protein
MAAWGSTTASLMLSTATTGLSVAVACNIVFGRNQAHPVAQHAFLLIVLPK